MEFVTKRLTREVFRQVDAELLSLEIEILRSGYLIFARPLTGEIAVPLAELLIKSKWRSVRYQAEMALLNMRDCAVEAEDILTKHFDGLMNELLSIKGVAKLNAWSAHNVNELNSVMKLVGRMKNEKSLQAIQKFLEIEDSKFQYMPHLKRTARYNLN